MNKQPIRHSEFYSFIIPDGNNIPIDFTNFKDKVVIIVNVASLCGYTPQYKELQYLYEKYHEQGLEILGFPCNQFGNQEPNDESHIVSFCQRHFGVSFPIMKKIYVNGEQEHELYSFLKSQKSGVLGFHGVRWNFEKFLIDKQGKVVRRFNSMITPLQFEEYIVTLLKS
ncbi:Peroxiredoxin HYR1 [Spathaspora sp. JA1]|nr:Peroxiredoxin HYR1 [Spathaspora sp. JA1]